MTAGTRKLIELAIENDASMDAAEKAAFLAMIDAKPQEKPERLMTIPEVAKLFGKTPKTIHYWCRHGILRKVTVGKQSRASGILASSVDALLKGVAEEQPQNPYGNSAKQQLAALGIIV